MTPGVTCAHFLCDATAGARPTLLQQLEHSVAVDEFGDIQLPADQSLAAATSSGAGNVGTGAAAAAAKLPKYAVKPGLGGIFFGKGQPTFLCGPRLVVGKSRAFQRRPLI